MSSGSVYPHCPYKNPQTRRPYKPGECPDWNKRGHKRWAS